MLRFHYTRSNEEVKQAKHMQETFQLLYHEMGAIVTSDPHGTEDNYGLEAPAGSFILGTIRMGNDPKSRH